MNWVMLKVNFGDSVRHITGFLAVPLTGEMPKQVSTQAYRPTLTKIVLVQFHSVASCKARYVSSQRCLLSWFFCNQQTKIEGGGTSVNEHVPTQFSAVQYKAPPDCSNFGGIGGPGCCFCHLEHQNLSVQRKGPAQIKIRSL